MRNAPKPSPALAARVKMLADDVRERTNQNRAALVQIHPNPEDPCHRGAASFTLQRSPVDLESVASRAVET